MEIKSNSGTFIYEDEKASSYREHLESLVRWRRDLMDLNLQNLNLRGMFLPGVSWCSSNFSGANLSGANISKSNLNYCDLRGARLDSACLSESSFQGMKLNRDQLEDFVRSLGVIVEE